MDKVFQHPKIVILIRRHFGIQHEDQQKIWQSENYYPDSENIGNWSQTIELENFRSNFTTISDS